MNMHTEHRKLLQKIKFHKYVVGERFVCYNKLNTVYLGKEWYKRKMKT